VVEKNGFRVRENPRWKHYLAITANEAHFCDCCHNVGLLLMLYSGAQRGAANGATAPDIQGRGNPKSEITKIKML